MNYYNLIKEELLDNEINKKVKDYSKKLTIDIGKRYDYSSL